MNEEVVFVQMFGGFELTYNGLHLDARNIRSEMVETLLVYMICHRNMELSVGEISEALWCDDESDNPVGALKNLMYRLRTICKKVLDKDDLIITGRGSYRWNPNIEVKADYENFEESIKKTGLAKKNRKQNLETAMQLYQGAFLPKLSRHHWILQLTTYYQSLYLSASKELMDIFDFTKDYVAVENLCNDVLKYDNLDERVHYMLILSLIKQDKKTLASEHYLAMSKLMYEELGVRTSKELQDLYQKILNQRNTREMDLSIIQHDLDEAMKPQGAYQCEYGIFKEIYRLEARRLARMHMSMHCGLISVVNNSSIPEKSDLYLKTVNKVMDQLGDVIKTTLRVGDIVSRYSTSQYVVLLPTCSYEAANKVIERVISNYVKMDNSNKMQLLYDVRELSLVEEMVS